MDAITDAAFAPLLRFTSIAFGLGWLIWSHYDFGHIVFEPMHMSREALDHGVAWVQREFYARRRITYRAWRSLHYLDPGILLRAVLPLNVGYRRKMMVDGTFQRGAEFTLPAISLASGVAKLEKV